MRGDEKIGGFLHSVKKYDQNKAHEIEIGEARQLFGTHEKMR
jgi:hypothetical protein